MSSMDELIDANSSRKNTGSVANKPFPRTGVSYVAQLEHDYLFSRKLTLCQNCFVLGTDVPLKRCQGCQLNDYCSKSCQKAKWSTHKPYCNLVQGKGPKNGYLTACPQEQVFKIVIDSYRLRCEVDHVTRQEDHGIYHPGKWEDNLIWAKGDAIDDFQRYLDLVETAGILPEWWTFENRMELMCLAIDKDNKENIFKAINQDDLIERYGGDTQIRNTLCILAEQAVGYQGKGPADDEGEWYQGFVKYLNDNPGEKKKAIKDSVEGIEKVFKAMGRPVPQASI